MGSESSTAASVRRAGPDDAGELASLINRAYEVERFFVEGERTDAAEVARLCDQGHFLALGDGTAGGELVAAVFVRADGTRGSIAMLSVAPEHQGQGLGKRLVAVAEAWCAAMGCDAMTLEVVNLRSELEAWYKSLGYRVIGTAPYTHEGAIRACHFLRMEKSLHESLAA
ncbi:MAG TPA: GNAT family N-acetyltransferase [Kofleriaceae bacterium]|nr:GNAT family N-acetyltransferase [Kofleriaceae bacterium]